MFFFKTPSLARRIFFAAMFGLLGASALCGLIFLVFPHSQTADPIVQSIATTALAAAMMLAASRLCAVPRLRPSGRVLIVLIFLELLLSVYIIWTAPGSTLFPFPSGWLNVFTQFALSTGGFSVARGPTNPALNGAFFPFSGTAMAPVWIYNQASAYRFLTAPTAVQLTIASLDDTRIWLLLTTIAAACFVRLSQSRTYFTAGPIALILCILAFIVPMCTTWLVTVSPLNLARSWQIAWVLLGLSIILPICLGGEWRNWWRMFGVGAAISAAILMLWNILSPIYEAFYNQLWGVLVCTAIIIALANLATRFELRTHQQWVRRMTLWMAGATALVICISLIFQANTEHDKDAKPTFGAQATVAEPAEDFITHIACALAICSAAGYFSIILLDRMNQKVRFKTTATEFPNISLTCPSCSTTQTTATGSSTCSHCGMRFSITIEEPHCPNCDYLLYMFKGDQCPECGTPIDQPKVIAI